LSDYGTSSDGLAWPKGFEFFAPTRIVYGAGKRSAISLELERIGAHRPLIVCSPRFGRSAEAQAILSDLARSCAVDMWAGVTPHSNLGEVDEICGALGHHQADSVVAVGGGSVLGAAKCAIAQFGEGVPLAERAWSYDPAQGRLTVPELKAPMLPLLAVPTIAGSSSETNQFGSVKDERTGEKVRVRGPSLAPRVAILDPELTLGLDTATTVGAAVNGFAHCVEILYSTSRDPVSIALVLAAAPMFFDGLPLVVKDEADIAARGTLLVGSALSGMALNNAVVALHHAMCHPLGNICEMPHGQANFIMLPVALKFNLPVVSKEMALLGRALHLLEDDTRPESDQAQDVYDGITEWLMQFDCPRLLRETGYVEEGDIRRLAESAFQDTCIFYNPRAVESADVLEDIYLEAW
jgi:alcohol dehydrogenase